jgi:hypothetical protein
MRGYARGGIVGFLVMFFVVVIIANSSLAPQRGERFFAIWELLTRSTPIIAMTIVVSALGVASVLLLTNPAVDN